MPPEKAVWRRRQWLPVVFALSATLTGCGSGQQAQTRPTPTPSTAGPPTSPPATASARPTPSPTHTTPTPATPATPQRPTATAAAPTPTATALPTVRSGSSGAAVLRLQRRLTELRYDLGAADGRFGVSTSHAVVAFQKVNGLAPTGVVTAAVWARLANPRRPALRYIRSGSGLEVSLGTQVMYRAAGGVLVAIYDVSTGRPALPTPTSGATPFHIWKRAMWGSTGYADMEQYVQYFVPGTLLAVHAYGYVPAYPASHGCIRLATASAARLWSASYAGERLYTY